MGTDEPSAASLLKETPVDFFGVFLGVSMVEVAGVFGVLGSGLAFDFCFSGVAGMSFLTSAFAFCAAS